METQRDRIHQKTSENKGMLVGKIQHRQRWRATMKERERDRKRRRERLDTKAAEMVKETTLNTNTGSGVHYNSATVTLKSSLRCRFDWLNGIC